MARKTMQIGKCRFCGCTEDNACITNGAPCAWLGWPPTGCNAPACAFAAGVEHGMRLMKASDAEIAKEVKRCMHNSSRVI